MVIQVNHIALEVVVSLSQYVDLSLLFGVWVHPFLLCQYQYQCLCRICFFFFFTLHSSDFFTDTNIYTQIWIHERIHSHTHSHKYLCRHADIYKHFYTDSGDTQNLTDPNTQSEIKRGKDTYFVHLKKRNTFVFRFSFTKFSFTKCLNGCEECCMCKFCVYEIKSECVVRMKSQ